MTSFLSILNPSATSTASITATYYAAGNRVGTQTISVAPGGRGTLTPGQLSLPTHVAATVTSDQPVVVERSIYRYKISEGTAGVVSSASAVIGSQALSDHWLFAEGYANKQSQENLVLSNLSANATTATITLEYQNGHNQTLTTSVAPFAQNVLNVNQANANPTGTCDTSPCSPTPEVSADVTSTSASLVVERQMFFHYTHTLPRTSVNVTAVGGADVQGTTSAATSSVNFAEGYTNTGYNEWLTLQNPTANSETLVVTLHNEYGRTYTQNVQISAKTRSTVDITDLVRSHLLQAGDDFKAYQVSMNVQTTSVNETFVAERPMYFQLSEGIQGGTDVVGFVGASPLPSPTPSPTTAVPTPSPTPAPQPYITEYSNGLTDSSDIRGITKGPDGNVWFDEDGANKIEYITPDGTITGVSTGETGTYPGEITTGSDGNLWFNHSSITSIGRMTPTGTVTEFSVTGFPNSNLYGITAGPDGNVWFTMVHDTKIGRITPDGTITEFSTGLTANAYPLAITAGSDGNVWFTEHEANQIGRITPTGTVTEFSTGLTANSGLWNITTGPDGNLWFTENTANQIGRITPDGTITEFSTGLTANSGPFGITKGPDGNLWFTENTANKIGRITPTGTITEFSTGLTANSGVQDITAGADGSIWFIEHSAKKIGRVNLP